MIPSRMVFLDALPLQPNGKLDRKALLGEQEGSADSKATLIAPRNAVEEKIVEIWRDILELDQVGITDNFFDLGGHSLLATRVFSRILQVYGVALTFRTLFDRPTVEELAREVISQHGPDTESTNEVLPGAGWP